MKALSIKTYPNPCLRVTTGKVEEFNGELKNILRSMADIMYVNQGIGLAAPQVGLGLSIMMVDIGKGLINFINPEIIEVSGRKTAMEEGCLSLPGISVQVKRPERVKIRAQNDNGEYFMKNYDGLYAKVVQHEVDHLYGKVIIDYLDPIRKFFAKRQLSASGNKERTCEVICHAGKTDK